MPKFIKETSEKLRKLAIRFGEVADRVLGKPAPALVPIPVPAKSRSKASVRR